MKKVMAAVFALVLTLGMGVTAMADSVTKTVNVKTDTTVSVSSATDKDGAAVATTIEDMVSNEVFMSSVMTHAGEVAANEGTNMDLLAVKNVSVPQGTTFPVTISFNVGGVKAGETVYVLHYSAIRNNWDTPQRITCSADGIVTATFNDLSPVAFLRQAAAPFTPPVQEIHPPEYYEQLKAMYGANTQEAAATATVSPKTAEDSGIAGFAAVAVLCTAAIVLTGKKKNA